MKAEGRMRSLLGFPSFSPEPIVLLARGAFARFMESGDKNVRLLEVQKKYDGEAQTTYRE